MAAIFLYQILFGLLGFSLTIKIIEFLKFRKLKTKMLALENRIDKKFIPGELYKRRNILQRDYHYMIFVKRQPGCGRFQHDEPDMDFLFIEAFFLHEDGIVRKELFFEDHHALIKSYEEEEEEGSAEI
jgi:hypothetical protein